MMKLINFIIGMKTSISQLKRFAISSCEVLMLLQFAIAAMLCKIITNLSLEYITTPIIMVCELLMLIVSIRFIFKFENAVSDIHTSNNVLTTIADIKSSNDKKSFEELLNMFIATRWILIIIFIFISCFSVILQPIDICIMSSIIVLGLFMGTLIDIVIKDFN